MSFLLVGGRQRHSAPVTQTTSHTLTTGASGVSASFSFPKIKDHDLLVVISFACNLTWNLTQDNR